MNTIFRTYSRILFTAVIAVLTLLPITAVHAQSSDTLDLLTPEEFVEEFHADIAIQEDGSVQVTERILYNFGTLERRGIFRTIPLLYTNAQGNDIVVDVQVESVTDGFDEPQPYLLTHDNSLEIRIGDPNIYVTGSQMYEITYSMYGVITRQDSLDELYWDVIGDQWEVPIMYAKATVTLPQPSSTNTRAACYSGFTGSADSTNCSASAKPSAFIYSTNTLAAREGFTIVSGFSSDIVTLPATLHIVSNPEGADIFLNDGSQLIRTTPLTTFIPAGTHQIVLEAFRFTPYETTLTVEAGQQYTVEAELEKLPLWVFLEWVLPSILGVLGLFGVYRLWNRYGKDPAGRSTIIPEFEAPENVYPAQAGGIVDLGNSMKQITATIIWLAVNGYLHIKKGEKKKDFSFIRKKERTDLETTNPVAFQVHKAIFGSKKKPEVTLKSLENKFGPKVQNIYRKLNTSLQTDGYVPYDIQKKKGGWMALGIVILTFSLVGGIWFGTFTGSPMYAIAGGIVGLTLMLMNKAMLRRTEKGVLTYQHIMGFKRYLTMAEKDRIAFFDSPEKYNPAEQFQNFLPYAVVLEVEEEWTKTFEDTLDEIPEWMEGDFRDTTSFMRSLAVMNVTTAKTLSSTPSQSSGSVGGGSGFSGGSVGGGFGGGGGGSW